jgi:hypothetical protein
LTSLTATQIRSLVNVNDRFQNFFGKEALAGAGTIGVNAFGVLTQTGCQIYYNHDLPGDLHAKKPEKPNN